MNPFQQDVFELTAPCLPCCSIAPPGCACALLIPASGTIPPAPYADYATAAAAILASVFNCSFYVPPGNHYDTYSAAFASATVTISAAKTPVDAINMTIGTWVSLNLKAGSTLSIAYDVETTGSGELLGTSFSSSLILCSGGDVDDFADNSATASAAGTHNISITDDGEYLLFFAGNSGNGASTAGGTFSAVITSSDTMTVNPVIALWDDSGTTRSLWACPKLLLPPLTESTGDWYASCADAAAVLTDPFQVSNCVGLSQSPAGPTFTATDGGSSLLFSLNAGGGPPLLNGGPFWGSVNGVAGQTLSIASTGFTHGNINIYDDTGTLVENLTGATPLTSSALPYTGRYTVEVNLSLGGTPSSCSATITSSGTMSVNPVQARWDDGLTCAALLNCGDACP